MEQGGQDKQFDQLYDKIEGELNRDQPDLLAVRRAYQQLITMARRNNFPRDEIKSLGRQLIIRLLDYGLHLKGAW